MTIEELLEMPIEKLEAMTDEDLREYFGPYLKFIKPSEDGGDSEETKDLFRVTQKKTGSNVVEKSQELAARLAKQLGIKL